MPGWLWLVLLASILVMFMVFPFDTAPTIDYSEFKALLHSKNLARVTFFGSLGTNMTGRQYRFDKESDDGLGDRHL